MSQMQLAQKCGVAQITISKIERNERRPSPELASRFAVIFGLTLQEIWDMFYSEPRGKKAEKLKAISE